MIVPRMDESYFQSLRMNTFNFVSLGNEMELAMDFLLKPNKHKQNA